ncbi:MAG: hypothetical protein MK110_10080 [Fuerstiella sp.]|nr:hypothetical protein [Fuerstiella sp.]
MALKRLFVTALLVRLALAVFFNVTELDRTLRLTKDGFVYTAAGSQIAEYYRSGGTTEWPQRVEGVINFLFYYIVGGIFFLTFDSLFMLRVMTCLAGAFTCVVIWRISRYITDGPTSMRAAQWAAWFPTQVYYSTLPVRDSFSTLAMCFIFLGLVAMSVNGKPRDIGALFVGLLLTAGFRTYMFVIVLVLIPFSWLVTVVFVKSRQASRLVKRAFLFLLVFAVVGAMAGIEKAFVTGKAAHLMSYESALDFANVARDRLNHGSGAMFARGDAPTIGREIVSTVQSIAVGLYFFVMSVNPGSLDSIRQWMAIPEVLIVMVMIPKLYRGVRRVWVYHRFSFMPLLIIAGAITFGYSGVTTNGGPMMRWRLQVANVYLIIGAIGYPSRYAIGNHSSQSRFPELWADGSAMQGRPISGAGSANQMHEKTE